MSKISDVVNKITGKQDDEASTAYDAITAAQERVNKILGQIEEEKKDSLILERELSNAATVAAEDDSKLAARWMLHGQILSQPKRSSPRSADRSVSQNSSERITTS